MSLGKHQIQSWQMKGWFMWKMNNFTRYMVWRTDNMANGMNGDSTIGKLKRQVHNQIRVDFNKHSLVSIVNNG